MLARSLALAILLAAGVGGLAAPAVHAQEMDTCYDTRFGRMGCVVVEEFNFSDPVLAENSRYVAWRAWVRNSVAKMMNYEPTNQPAPTRATAPNAGR
jgi:hypothetical protein